jgi:hypothetical protein
MFISSFVVEAVYGYQAGSLSLDGPCEIVYCAEMKDIPGI